LILLCAVQRSKLGINFSQGDKDFMDYPGLKRFRGLALFLMKTESVFSDVFDGFYSQKCEKNP